MIFFRGREMRWGDFPCGFCRQKLRLCREQSSQPRAGSPEPCLPLAPGPQGDEEGPAGDSQARLARGGGSMGILRP